MSAPSQRRATGVSITALAALIAACLPWGTVDLSRMPTSGRPGGEMGDAFRQIIAAMGPVTVTVWNGHAGFGPLRLPNVLVVLAGLAAAVMTWLEALSIWNVPAKFLIALAGYGLLHSAYVLLCLLFSDEGSPAAGVFLTTVAFIGMFIVVVKREPSSGTAATSAAGPPNSSPP